MERNKLIIKPSIEEEYTGSPTVDIDGDGVKISNFKEFVIDGKVHLGAHVEDKLKECGIEINESEVD